MLPPEAAAVAAAPFQPLDCNVVSAAIPQFFIGRNRQGFWVVRDTKAATGGIFLSERSALRFVARHSQATGCATIYPSARFELDLENSGNPLVGYLVARSAMIGRIGVRALAVLAVLAIVAAALGAAGSAANDRFEFAIVFSCVALCLLVLLDRAQRANTRILQAKPRKLIGE